MFLYNSKAHKRIILTVICLAIFFTFPVCARAVGFSDLPQGNPAWRYIIYLQNRGIVSGFPDGTFHPWEGVTRAQAAKLLIMSQDIRPVSPEEPTFKDVDKSHWAYSCIEAAAGAGFLHGYPDGSFRPERGLSRAEAAALLFRLTGNPVPQVEIGPVADLSKDHWAYKYITAAIDAGMMQFLEDKSFEPERTVSRAGFMRNIVLIKTLAPDKRIGKLTTALTPKKGDVFILQVGEKEPVKVEVPVTVGLDSRILTGAGAEAEMVFDDGSSVLLEEKTDLVITGNEGSFFILPEGKPGYAVDNLHIKINSGQIYGALATRVFNEESTEPEQKNENGSNKKAAGVFTKNNMLAWAGNGLPDNLPLAFSTGQTLAQQSGGGLSNSAPWWKEAYVKKARVTVDMPWGVAGIRGTFYRIRVVEGGQHVSVLSGEATVTAAGQTVNLTNEQQTDIKSAQEAPVPPAKFELTEARAWLALSQWAKERAQEITQKAPEAPKPMSEPVLPKAETGIVQPEKPFKPVEETTPAAGQTAQSAVQTVSNRIENELSKLAASTSTSTPAGGGGSGGGTIKVDPPEASPKEGNYPETTVIELTARSGAKIYYTIDGAEPTADSLLYTGPITISKTTIIKAVAVYSGKTSATATFCYYIGIPSLIMVIPQGKMDVYLPAASLEGRVESLFAKATLKVEAEHGWLTLHQKGTDSTGYPVEVNNSIQISLIPGESIYFSLQLDRLPMASSVDANPEVTFTVTDDSSQHLIGIAHYVINRVPGFIIKENAAAVYGYTSEPETTVCVRVYSEEGVLKSYQDKEDILVESDIDGFFAIGGLLPGGEPLTIGDWLQVKEEETRRIYQVRMSSLWQTYLDATRRQAGAKKIGPGKEIYMEVQETPVGAWRLPGRLIPGGGEYIFDYSSLVESGHLSLAPQPAATGNEYLLAPAVRIAAGALSGPAYFVLETTRRALDLDINQGQVTISGTELAPSWQNLWLKVNRSGSIIHSGTWPAGNEGREGDGGFVARIPEEMEIIAGDILNINNIYQITVPLTDVTIDISVNGVKAVEGYLLVNDRPAAGSPVEITAGDSRIVTGVSPTGDFRVEFSGGGVSAEEITIKWFSPQWHTVTWHCPIQSAT